MYEGIPPTPPRPSGFWDALAAYLDADPTIRSLLGGAGRVSLSYKTVWPGLGENQQWTRIVVVPIVRGYPVEAMAGESALTPFLIRVDLHAPGGVVPISKGELVHNRVFALLYGWRPVGVPDVAIYHAVYRVTAPEPVPVKDPEGDVSFMSAEYRVLLESPDITP